MPASQAEAIKAAVFGLIEAARGDDPMAHEMSVQAEAGLILIAEYLQSLPLIAEALGVKSK